MEPKNWTEVSICSRQNRLLYSFILKTQNILDIDERMREELSGQEDGAYATAYRWEDLDEDGTSPLFPCYGIDKQSPHSVLMTNAVLDAFKAIFRG